MTFIFDIFSIEHNYKLASSENSPTEVLTELSTHKNTSLRKAVASNPNTPVEVLERLSEEFPEIVRANPVFDLLFLENPNSRFVKLTLARSSTTSTKTLSKLIYDRDPEIRTPAIANPNTTLELLEESLALAEKELIFSEYRTSICEAIVCNPNASSEIIDLAFQTGKSNYDRQLCWGIIHHSNTSASTLEKLPYYLHKNFRTDILKHPNVAPQTIAAIKFIEGEIEPDFDWWQQLADNANYRIRRLVAEHENIPQKILIKLSQDYSRRVRRAIAKNPVTPLEILIKLAEDYSEKVRLVIAENSIVPTKILELLAQDEDKRIRIVAASNINMPKTLLAKLAKDEDKYIRKGVARNHNTPPNILALLAEDSHEYIRMGVANNPATPMNIIDKLSQDKSWRVRKGCRGSRQRDQKFQKYLASKK